MLPRGPDMKKRYISQYLILISSSIWRCLDSELTLPLLPAPAPRAAPSLLRINAQKSCRAQREREGTAPSCGSLHPASRDEAANDVRQSDGSHTYIFFFDLFSWILANKYACTYINTCILSCMMCDSMKPCLSNSKKFSRKVIASSLFFFSLFSSCSLPRFRSSFSPLCAILL